MSERVRCDACGVLMPADATYRADDDGFTACMPSFPVSNEPEDSNRFMEGPCYAEPEGVWPGFYWIAFAAAGLAFMVWALS